MHNFCVQILSIFRKSLCLVDIIFLDKIVQNQVKIMQIRHMSTHISSDFAFSEANSAFFVGLQAIMGHLCG